MILKKIKEAETWAVILSTGNENQVSSGTPPIEESKY
jgi:hypothetical protein